MRRIAALTATLVAIVLPLQAQETVPVFAVPSTITTPLPAELTEPESFHTRAVGIDGSLRLSFADISVSARGWPLTMARTYRKGTPDTGLGPDWAWSLAPSISRERDTGTYIIADGNGEKSAYADLAASYFEAVSGRLGSRLYDGADGHLNRLYSDGSREIFDAEWRIIRREDASGDGYGFIYQNGVLAEIKHDDGQTMQFAWSDGRLASVEDELGRSMRFEFDGGRLVGATDALARVTRYRYDDSGRLAGVVFADGATVTAEYDLNDRVARLSGPGALESRFGHWGAIEEGRLVQTRIDAEERRWRVEIVRDPALADQLSIIATGPGGIETVRDYRDGQVDVSVNGIWAGAVVFDGVGEAMLLVEPEGTVPLPGAEDGVAPLADPDMRGNPRLVVSPGAGSYWQESDIAGRVIAIAGSTGRVEQFTYDLGDRLIEHRDASGLVTTYDYDAADRPLGWRAGDGRFRTISYTPEGLVAEISGEDIAGFRYSHDRTGWLVSFSDGNAEWRVEYDNSGQIVGVIDAAGLGSSIAYDETGRLAGFTDDFGLSIAVATEGGAYITDELGRVRGIVTDDDGSTGVISAGGTRIYSEEIEDGDLLVTAVLPDGQGWVERRDAAGALVSGEALSDKPYFIDTDDQGRVVALGDPLLPSTVSYGEDGLVTEITDRIGVPTLYSHDEQGRLVSAASPYLGVELEYGDGDEPIRLRTSDGVTLTQEIDALGRPVHFTYENDAGVRREERLAFDDQSRLIRIETDGEVTEIAYVDDNITEMTVSAGGGSLTWREVYDPLARVLTITRPDDSESVTTYDAGGRVISIAAPERRVDYELDAEGQVLAVTTDGIRADLASEDFGWRVVEEAQVETQPDGTIRIQTIRDPAGNFWQTGYAYDGFAIWSKDPKGGVTRVERAASGQITSVTDPEGRAHYATYDDLGRAMEMGVAQGWAVAFGWEGTDPAGRAYSGGAEISIEPSKDWTSYRTMTDGAETARYDFDAEGRIASATNELGSVSVEYGGAGEVAGVTDVFGRRIGQEFDGLGRVSALVLPSGKRIEYGYTDGNTIIQTGPDGGITQTHYESTEAAYSIDLPDDVTARLKLAAGDVFSSLTVTGGNDRQSVLAVERAADGGVTKISLNGSERSIERDTLGRMMAVESEHGRATWQYDGSGNIVTDENDTKRRYNAAWQLVENGSERLEYDLDGRLVRQGERTFAYDASGRLIATNTAAGLTRYAYDPFGRLVERRRDEDIEQYLWYEGQVLAVFDGDGNRLALIERNLALPSYARVHDASGVTAVLPDQIGTPLFEASGNSVSTLPIYGPWGEAPIEGQGQRMRWLGYAGHLAETGGGGEFVHMGARVYLPGIARFNAPDPLGIDNPVNPYAYASFEPLTYVDSDGHNTQAPDLGPFYYGVGNLNPERGLPTGSIRNTPESRQFFGQVLDDLERVAANDSRPHVRRAASETLHTLRTNGVRLDIDTGIAGAGDQLGGQIRLNPGEAARYGARAAENGLPARPVRASGAVLGHEGRHIVQEGFERGGANRTLGRLWKEFDATLHGSNVERGLGGFRGGAGSERRAVQRAMEYAFRTEYRQYLPANHPSRLSNNFAGTGHPAFRGITQMDPDAVARIARHHFPEVPRDQVLDDLVRTTERYRANPAAEGALRSQGPNAAYARDRMLREARAAASRARTASITPARPTPRLPETPGARATAARPTIEPPRATRPGATPPRPAAARPTIEPPRTPRPNQPTIEPPRTPRPNQPTIEPPRAPRPNQPTIEPPRVNPNRPTIEPPRVGPRAAPPPQPGSRVTTRLPRSEIPGARVTQRLPASELPGGSRAVPPSARPSGAAPDAHARPTATRPTTARPPAARPPTVRPTASPPATRPRPPVSRPPPSRNPRPAATPDAPRPRPASAPNRPSVRPEAPRPSRSAAMPDRPIAAPDGGARPPHGARPSAQGGRHRIPDLQGGRSGGRVRPPPGGIGSGPHGRPPRMPRGGQLNVPDTPNFARGFGKALGGLGVALDLYSHYQYLEGDITTEQYLTGWGLSTAGYLLPYPLNAAIAAHQVGSFIGGYLANQLLQDAANGNKAAQALLDWFRRSGWINSNDPTFVAEPEAWPPALLTRALLATNSASQWLPLTIWSQIRARADMVLADAGGVAVVELGVADLSPGANRRLLPPETLAGLTPGLYAFARRGAEGALTTERALRVVAAGAPASDEPIVEPSGFTVTPNVIETRLEPTDLPWERFDRPEALIDGPFGLGTEAIGEWLWFEDADAPGGHSHTAAADGPPVHYALFETPQSLTVGDNLVQYLWLDPNDPPAQLVLQLYDETLSAAHRISLGTDLLPFEDRGAFGFVAGGPLPQTGVWKRLRLPVAEIGMDGRRIAGIAFLTDGGGARFGPTKFSGGEDSSPRLVDAAGRDTGGAPDSDFKVQVTLPEAGELELTLVLRNDAEVTLFDGSVGPGVRSFWWQGEAGLLAGAQVSGQYAPERGAAEEIDVPITGNPGLVARILYPPQGAVVRQTVPVFGQAGGSGFTEYVVEMRPFGAGATNWQELVRSGNPTVMTDAQIRHRIDTIQSQQLRSTVYGNVASLETGSALHHFEFADASEVLQSGWIELRLRCYDEAGNFAEAWTAVQVGEVATGQDRTELVSPDGVARLTIPPLVLPTGMGTIALDLANQILPPGAPTAAGPVYAMAPSGLRLRAPVTLSLDGQEGTAIALTTSNGGTVILPTERDGTRLAARLPATASRARFYATTVPPPPPEGQKSQRSAPWFASAPAPGLMIARQASGGTQPSFVELDLTSAPLGLVASLRVIDVEDLALLLRFDSDARLVPLGNSGLGVRSGMASEPLGLSANPEPQSVFLALSEILPAGAQQLEGVELVRISSVAWQTIAADTPSPAVARIETLAIGTLPASGADAWQMPASGRLDGSEFSAGILRPDSEGWSWAKLDEDAVAWPLLIDRTAPRLHNPGPAVAGAEASELTLTVTVDETGSGLAWRRIALEVNGEPVTADLWRIDRASGKMTLALGEVPGLRLPNGGEIAVELNVTDQLGLASKPLQWRWRYRAEAMSIGNLTQLTVDGGSTPAWLPDASGFVFATPRDGANGLQSDIARYDLVSGDVSDLSETPQNETAPAVGPEGRLGWITESGLRVVEGATAREAEGAFTGLVWGEEGWLATTGNTIVDPFALASPPLCEGATGATLSSPRLAAGGMILFTQSIYHRTIWRCDPTAGTVTPLSLNPDSPATRDVDVAPASPQAIFFAKGDGTAGIWRRDIGGRREALVLTAEGGIDRAMAMAPDGLSMLFESDRSGRREIWRMDFSAEASFFVDANGQSGAAGVAIEGSFEGVTEGADWRIVDNGGQNLGIELEARIDAGRFTLIPASDMPEGLWQIELVTGSGARLRQPLAIDRTPPKITVVRLRDGATLDNIGDIAPGDRFALQFEDPAAVLLRDLDSGEALSRNAEFAALAADAKPRRIAATDDAGNRAQFALDLAVGSSAGSRLSTADPASTPAPDVPESGGGTMPWITIIVTLIGLVIAGVVIVVLRRRRRS